jgi:hypothetical protein
MPKADASSLWYAKGVDALGPSKFLIDILAMGT